MTPLAMRVWGEYTEMPGLHLTVRQAARLFDVPSDVAGAVLHELQRASILTTSDDGTYALITDPSRTRTGAAGESSQSRGRML
jgi:hypothetical protein